MPFAQIYTRARVGIDAPEVRVEVHISNGLPVFAIVGLPETAVREARDRVRSAIQNTGFEFPSRRITVNLAPADLPKEGGRYDLPIALGILAASAQVNPSALEGLDCYGELALSGDCAGVASLLPALVAGKMERRGALIPSQNRHEASLIGDFPIQHADSLAQICSALNGGSDLPRIETVMETEAARDEPDLVGVSGQMQAKRALEIAASGGHHLLMMGPPGCGKSMLAQRFGSLLPKLGEQEAMQCASIRSACGLPIDRHSWCQRPFRAPHHTVSAVALAGGGGNPRPGEISLAHNGVLFLDELTEFDRRAIEVLREPLETGQIQISRARRQAVFPARFQLISAMNPCPGGCESIRSCDCSPEQLNRYRNKLSAPILDRIDLQLELARPNRDELRAGDTREKADSRSVRRRVRAARERQLRRQDCLNAELEAARLSAYCRLDAASEALLDTAADKLRLSVRGQHKLLRLARSIADLAGQTDIRQPQLAEALLYRQLPNWRR